MLASRIDILAQRAMQGIDTCTCSTASLENTAMAKDGCSYSAISREMPSIVIAAHVMLLGSCNSSYIPNRHREFFWSSALATLLLFSLSLFILRSYACSTPTAYLIHVDEGHFQTAVSQQARIGRVDVSSQLDWTLLSLPCKVFSRTMALCAHHSPDLLCTHGYD